MFSLFGKYITWNSDACIFVFVQANLHSGRGASTRHHHLHNHLTGMNTSCTTTRCTAVSYNFLGLDIANDWCIYWLWTGNKHYLFRFVNPICWLLTTVSERWEVLYRPSKNLRTLHSNFQSNIGPANSHIDSLSCFRFGSRAAWQRTSWSLLPC